MSFAFGHMLVELPLVLILSFGLLAAASAPAIKNIIGLVGGAALIAFGALQIHETITSKSEPNNPANLRTLPTSAVLLGAVLTGLNPYFILWWITIGSALIVRALAFAALLGVLLMYASHVWMDYAFLTSLAHFAKKGRAIIGSKYYKLVLVAFSIILMYYGASFVVDAIRT